MTSFKLPDGVEFFKPEKGFGNLIDIIGYRVTMEGHPDNVAPGTLWYRRKIWVHYGIGPEEKVFICPKTIHRACPICEEFNKLKKNPNADEDVLKGLKAKWRVLYNVIDRNDPQKGVQLWDISHFNFGELLDSVLGDAAAGDLSFYEPIDGRTFKIKFKSKSMGQGSPFLAAEIIQLEQRKKDYREDIVEDALDLDAIMVVLDYKALQREFVGLGEDRDDTPPRRNSEPAADADEAPPRRRSESAADADEPQRRRSEPVDEAPPRRSAPAADVQDDDPPRRRREPAADADEAPPRRRSEPVVEEEPPRRRSAPAADVQDDDPPRRRAPAADAQDEAPPRRRAPVADADADDAPPRRRAPVADADEAPPRRRSEPAADVQDEEPPRRRRPIQE
jgi:hypothetical protein